MTAGAGGGGGGAGDAGGGGGIPAESGVIGPRLGPPAAAKRTISCPLAESRISAGAEPAKRTIPSTTRDGGTTTWKRY